jgi:hypothetical protein
MAALPPRKDSLIHKEEVGFVPELKNYSNDSTAFIDRANLIVYITLTFTTGGQNQDSQSQKNWKPHLDAQDTTDIQR